MRPPPEMPRIEFFGLPGSGKTTIARHLHRLLSADVVPLRFAPDLLRDGASSSGRAAAKLRLVASSLGPDGRRLVRLACALPQPTLRDRVRGVFTLATVLALYDRLERRGEGAVLDQGLLQALWSLELRAPADRGGRLRAAVLGHSATSARTYVCVETPVLTCAERLRVRASRHSRLQAQGVEADSRIWRQADLLRRAILSSVEAVHRRSGLCPGIIVVDGAEDPQHTARQVAARLLSPTMTPASSRRMSEAGASA